MIIKKLSFAFIVLLFVTCLAISNVGHCGQTAEVEDLTAIRTNFLNDVEKILGSHDQDIAQIESDLNTLNEELKNLDTIEKKLIDGKLGGDVLALVKRHREILKERTGVLNETKLIRVETTEVAGNLEEELKAMSALSDRKRRINDEASLLPTSQFEGIQKEAELLEARLEAILAKEKEKEAYLLTMQTAYDTEKPSLVSEKERLQKETEEFTHQETETPERNILGDIKKRILENRLRLQDDKIDLLFAQARVARLGSQYVRVQRLNIETEKDIKTEIAGILSPKFEEVERQRKEKEAEEAKEAEAERREIAEEEKARAELEKRRALLEEEIAVQKQLEETSPERKRVLEVEADIHKEEGFIATIKDELINIGIESDKDRVESKVVQGRIEELLGGENTPGEITDDMDVIESESERIQARAESIQSLLSATEKQKAIIEESLDNAYANITSTVPGEKSSIEEEAEGFSDKVLGEQLVKLADLHFKRVKEQKKLIEIKIEEVKERLESNKILLDKLADAGEELLQIRAANVWARRENQITTSTIIDAFSDIKFLKDKPFDFYKASVQNLNKLRVYLADTENMPAFIKKVIIIAFVIFFTFFARRFLKKLAKRKMERFTAISPQTFFTYELIPGLLRIMRSTLTMFSLFVIVFTISLTIPSDTPVILSAIYGFTILSVYKFLRGAVAESFSPYTGGRRWVPVTYFSAKDIFEGLNRILIFSAITITLIYVFNAYSYRKDVIELLWFVYRIVTIFLVIWIAASQRSVLLKVLPFPESALGRLVNKIINILYPLLIAFIILLFAVRSLGYAQLTYTLIVILVKSVVVSIIAYVVCRFLSRQLLHSQARKLELGRELGAEEFEFEKRSLNLKSQLYKSLLDYGILIIAVVIIFGMWNDTFRDVVGSKAAPKLFRGVYENILYVFTTIKSGLTHKFVLAEGRYTTPFKMLIGILVLVAAFICTRYLKNILRTRIYDRAQLEQGARHAISAGITYFVIGVAAIIGLNIAGIPLRSLTIFAGAFGIGLGFGMQNIINNLVSGIIIFFEKPIRIGDVITLDKEIGGKVEKISIRSTSVKTFDRKTVVIPNSKFLESNVENWVHGGDMILRSKIVVGVAYGSDTELVRNCLLEVADMHASVKKDPMPIVRFAEFGDSSLNFELYFWAHVFERWMTVSDLNFAIDRVFRENNIEIPFPQRDLHIRSGESVETQPATLTKGGMGSSNTDSKNPQIGDE